MTRVTTAWLLATLVAGGATASAQAPAAPATAAPATAPAGTPAPAAATPATAAPAASAPPAPAATAETDGAAATVPASPAPPAAEAAPPAKSEDEIFRERLALERARLRAMMAKVRLRGSLNERVDEDPEVYGDAGAAIAVGASIEQGWVTDRGYDLFAEDDVALAFGLWASHDLVSLADDLVLAAEVGWGTASEDETAFDGSVLTADLMRNRFHAGGRLRWVPLDLLQPHVRVAGGVDWTRWSVETSAPEEYRDWDLSPFASAGLGVLVRSPTRSFENRRGQLASLSVGVMVEGGYLLLAPLGLELDSNPDDADIALAEPSLGEITRSGPYLKTSIVVGF